MSIEATKKLKAELKDHRSKYNAAKSKAGGADAAHHLEKIQEIEAKLREIATGKTDKNA